MIDQNNTSTLIIATSNRLTIFIAGTARLCVTLKCISGPHIGQKFRLEPTTVGEIR